MGLRGRTMGGKMIFFDDDDDNHFYAGHDDALTKRLKLTFSVLFHNMPG